MIAGTSEPPGGKRRPPKFQQVGSISFFWRSSRRYAWVVFESVRTQPPSSGQAVQPYTLPPINWRLFGLASSTSNTWMHIMCMPRDYAMTPPRPQLSSALVDAHVESGRRCCCYMYFGCLPRTRLSLRFDYGFWLPNPMSTQESHSSM